MTDQHRSRCITVEVPSDLALLELTHCLAQEIPQALGVPAEEAEAMANAVLEAVGNAMRHGNHLDPSVPVSIVFSVDEGTITVTVSDRGKGFDPASLCDPTSSENLLKCCGRGFFLMRAFTDSVHVSSRHGGGTTVTLRRAFAA